MNVDLTIKNYRCFPDSSPARIAIRKGFTALLGPNNSGKSSLLKFFYELRNLFIVLSTPDSGNVLAALRGDAQPFGLQGVQDLPELYSNLNNRDISIQFDFTPTSDDPQPTGMTPRSLTVTLTRNHNLFKIANLTTNTGVAAPLPNLDFLVGGTIGHSGTQTAHLAPIQDAIRPLANTVYLAAFRNTINAGAQQNYYDIPVGQAFLRAWKQLKGGTVKQTADATVRLTRDIQRIFGFNYLEINTSADESTLQVVVNDRTFRLDELGSGLSQFILVLATIASRQQHFILIDEPELNLHPSLQMDFLTTVASYARDGVLFGTHSIGLARAVGQQVTHSKERRKAQHRSDFMMTFLGSRNSWAN